MYISWRVATTLIISFLSVFDMKNITLCVRTWRGVRNFAWHRIQCKLGLGRVPVWKTGNALTISNGTCTHFLLVGSIQHNLPVMWVTGSQTPAGTNFVGRTPSRSFHLLSSSTVLEIRLSIEEMPISQEYRWTSSTSRLHALSLWCSSFQLQAYGKIAVCCGFQVSEIRSTFHCTHLPPQTSRGASLLCIHCACFFRSRNAYHESFLFIAEWRPKIDSNSFLHRLSR